IHLPLLRNDRVPDSLDLVIPASNYINATKEGDCSKDNSNHWGSVIFRRASSARRSVFVGFEIRLRDVFAVDSFLNSE
ncbi:MAG: hypothetical protein ACR2IJ_08395, partial [Fluviibacter sp.]